MTRHDLADLIDALAAREAQRLSALESDRVVAARALRDGVHVALAGAVLLDFDGSLAFARGRLDALGQCGGWARVVCAGPGRPPGVRAG